MSSVGKHSSCSKFIANVYRLVCIPHSYAPFGLFQSLKPLSVLLLLALLNVRLLQITPAPLTRPISNPKHYARTPSVLRHCSIFKLIIIKIARSNTRYPPFHRPVSCRNSRQLNHFWPPRTSHRHDFPAYLKATGFDIYPPSLSIRSYIRSLHFQCLRPLDSEPERNESCRQPNLRAAKDYSLYG